MEMQETSFLRGLIRRWGAAGLLVVAAILALRWLWLRKRAVFVALVLLCALLFALPLLRGDARQLRVTVLDVGKGDAIVIEAPMGETAVVDVGGLLPNGRDRAREVVLPYLRQRRIGRVQTLLLSHPHPDHIGGAASLINGVTVGEVVDNGESQEDPLVRRYREAAQSRNVPCRQARRGETISLGDRVLLRVLAPPATAQGRTNNTSIVLRVEYGMTAFLLTGDVEAEAENEMIATDQPLTCQVLKVAHHGSNQSSTAPFLSAARPRFAVISVNANNRNGYPDPAVLERLKAVGAETYRTDRNGNVMFTSDGSSVGVEPAR
jgi:competence protein ComEC